MEVKVKSNQSAIHCSNQSQVRMSKEEDISAKDLQDDKVKRMKRMQHDDLPSVKEEEDDLECSFSPPMENKLCRFFYRKP